MLKSDIVEKLLTYNCPISTSKMKKMNKNDLMKMLTNYEQTTDKPTRRASRRPKNIAYNFSESDNDDDDDDENDIMNELDNLNLDLDDQEVKQEVKQPIKQPKVNLKQEVNQIIKNFNLNTNDLIKQYKNDNDTDYLIDQYNMLVNEIESELSDLLSSYNADEKYYKMADNKINIQNNRVERLIK
jgi:hypothetical protein